MTPPGVAVAARIYAILGERGVNGEAFREIVEAGRCRRGHRVVRLQSFIDREAARAAAG